jgi:hypothetical protein
MSEHSIATAFKYTHDILSTKRIRMYKILRDLAKSKLQPEGEVRNAISAS